MRLLVQICQLPTSVIVQIWYKFGTLGTNLSTAANKCDSTLTNETNDQDTKPQALIYSTDTIPPLKHSQVISGPKPGARGSTSI